MARIFITGSADGLGLLAAKELIRLGHRVVLHARNSERADKAIYLAAGAEGVLTADLSDLQEVKNLAEEANALGTFDAVIHNAGVYQQGATDAGGLTDLLKVNTLAPYILTCLMHRPQRLIYLSSGMHRQGNAGGLERIKRATYSDTKLYDLILAKAVARQWPGVCSNAVDPGWVPTKMSGQSAPDSLEQGYQTQVWLAVGADAQALVSGNYFHHKKQHAGHPEADNIEIQEIFLEKCRELTTVQLNNTKN